MTIYHLFNKDIHELELLDIEKYFKATPFEESDSLEYKSYAADKQKGNHKGKEEAILKTICGFLNSEGGVIIWGAPESKLFNGEQKLEKELSPFIGVVNKDSFISKVLHRIIPSPQGIKCNPIQISDTESIIIIEVPKSTYRPHQLNSKYYMRADGQTIIAPHHYIEALFKQVSYPILTGKIELRSTNKRIIEKVGRLFIECEINLIVENRSMYLNEKNLSISLVVDNTYQTLRDEVHLVAHYGKPIIKVEKIHLPIQYMYSLNRSEIAVMFGGEKSPIRVSRYLLEFKLDDSKVNDEIKFIELVGKEENKFPFEQDDDELRKRLI